MKLSDFSLFDAPEPESSGHLLAERINQTATPYPRARTIADLFAEQAVSTPAAIAVCQGETTLTYRALDRRSNQLARYLSACLGSLDGRVVALSLPRGPALIVAMLAVLKTGAAYLPLDIAYPRARRAQMLHAADAASMIVGQESDGEGLGDREDGGDAAEPPCPVVNLDRLAAEIDGQSVEALHGTAPTTPDSLAYVMFTSGSTGTPKGVMVPQRGVVRLVRGQTFADLGPEQVFLLNAPVSFDAATLEIWAPLLNGGQLAIMPPGPTGLAELGEAIARHGVTTLWLTAGIFNLAIDQAPEALRPLRQLLIGGEALSPRHVRRALELLPHCRLINGYGPTENTTFSCCFEITRDACRDKIPIGRPIANSTAYVLDGEMTPVPAGVTGDLYVGGDGLALGYLNDPEKTARQFIDHPWQPGAGLYRTGDLASWRADGTIDFHGRADKQIKLRGYRIEPGEVEAALLDHPAVRQVVVDVFGTDAEQRILVAYLVGAAPIDLDGVRRHLNSRLPAFMVPSALIQLDSLPLTPNGKIDRAALPAPVVATPAGPTIPTPPEGETEQRLLALWQEVLERSVPGVTENFFALGGHSLAAAKLIARIENTFGVALAFTTAFTAPTVRELAQAVLDAAAFGNVGVDQEMVRLAGERDGPAMFALPPGTSDALSYARLAAELAPYDVHAFNFIESGDRLERYADLIQQTQPSGPYLLFGYSGGGNLAFHLALRLEARGHRVSDVVMLDSSRFLARIPFPKTEAERLAKEFLADADVREVAHSPLLQEKAYRRIQRYYDTLSNLIDDTPIAGDIHLIASPTTPITHADADGTVRVSQTAWADVTHGRFQWHTGHGAHGEMLNEPYFSSNLRVIRAILDTAAEARTLDAGKSA